MILETERLVLRRFTTNDAGFVVELLNDPGWLHFIGDRGVRSLEQAVDYIETGPIQMYATYGFGLYLAELKTNHVPIGMCGLVQRNGLDDVDIGFAFLERYQGQGYALEAAMGVVTYAAFVLRLNRLVAITTKENNRSARLLEKLGLRFERMVPYPDENNQMRLFACRLADLKAGG